MTQTPIIWFLNRIEKHLQTLTEEQQQDIATATKLAILKEQELRVDDKISGIKSGMNGLLEAYTEFNQKMLSEMGNLDAFFKAEIEKEKQAPQLSSFQQRLMKLAEGKGYKIQ